MTVFVLARLCFVLERYRSGHNGAVLKTVRVKAHGGSNPSRSAIRMTSPSGEVIYILKEVLGMKSRRAISFACFFLVMLLMAGCTAAKGSVKVKQGQDLSKTVDLTAMECEPVQGTAVDADGNAVSIDTTGVLLSDVLMSAGIESSWIGDIEVQSRDKQTTDVAGSVLNMADKAYLTPEEDGTWTLVVLGKGKESCILKDVVFLHAQNI